MAGKKKLTILEVEGMHQDNTVEDEIFASTEENPHDYEIEFVRGFLSDKSAEGEGLLPFENLPKDLCERVDGLMIFRHFVGAKEIAMFPNLKVAVRCGVGYDRLDRKAFDAAGVSVHNVPNYGTGEIADHAIGLALSLRRGIIINHELMKKGGAWAASWSPVVARIQGATFGVFGLGRIGTAAALRAKAFGWNVVFYDPYLPNGVDRSLGITRVKKPEDLFKISTVVSIHCPHTTETRGYINKKLLDLLPPQAILVNTARGECINLDDVYEALKSGKLAGVALDVLPVEPPPEPLHPLYAAYRANEDWIQGRMVMTPHAAFFSPSSWDDIRSLSAQTMREVLIEGKKTNLITVDME